MTKVVIILGKINRKSGGSASALDLIETMHSLDIDCGIAVQHYERVIENKFDQFFGKTKSSKTNLPLNIIYPIPTDFLGNTNRKRNKSSSSKFIYRRFRKAFSSIYERVFDPQNKFLNDISAAHLIIDARLSSDTFLSKIRKISNAKIILNHAGSPGAYEKYWLSSSDRLGDIRDQTKKYIERCKLYDGALFQSKIHAEECIAKKAMTKESCFVIEPSSLESQVLSIQNEKSPYIAGTKNIVYIGSIKPRKAQHLSFESFSKIASKFTDYHLHFVGGGLSSEYGAKLKTLTEKSSFSGRVYFHGHRDDHLRFLKNADILIQSSKEEGVSRVFREAMLMKVPIVAFALSGTRSILDDGINALLAKPGDTDEMADKLDTLIGDEDLKETLVNNAYTKYLNNFSSPVYMKQIRNLIFNVDSDSYSFSIEN